MDWWVTFCKDGIDEVIYINVYTKIYTILNFQGRAEMVEVFVSCVNVDYIFRNETMVYIFQNWDR